MPMTALHLEVTSEEHLWKILVTEQHSDNRPVRWVYSRGYRTALEAMTVLDVLAYKLAQSR